MVVSDEFLAQNLKTSLDHLTNQLLQTRFQIDEVSRAALRSASTFRRTLVICTAVLSMVTLGYIVVAVLPRFVPAASMDRSWVLWRQVGGTWDPLSGWPTKEACEAATPRSRQVELGYRCLPDSVDPRGATGK